jgi:transcriptional regulator with XRE-family HTH domain
LRAAEWLTREREESGLTVEEAAEAARVSPTTIWRRENGLVDLGPLRQVVAMQKAREIRRIK